MSQPTFMVHRTMPIYELQSLAGNTVEIGNDKTKVMSAFHSARYPRHVYQINPDGTKHIIHSALE